MDFARGLWDDRAVKHRLVVALALVAVALATPGAGSTTSASSGGTWVGPLQGSRAFVAIVSDGDQIAAYVCDNGTVGSWFFGPTGADGRIALAGRDGAGLDVTLARK